MKKNLGLVVASILMLIFVASDLLFDFAFNFNASDYIAFGFTLAASIITFVATYKVKQKEILTAFDKTTAFVQSNFNNWQVVFSILDIVCGIISILSGLIIIGGVFKFVKVSYLITKFIVVTNKTKTLAKSVGKFSLLWTAGRILTKKQGGEMSTKKLSKTQIATIIAAVIGIVFAIVSVFVPQIAIAGDMIYNIGIATGIEAVAAFVGTFKGYAERTKEQIDALTNKKKAKELEEAKAFIAQHDAEAERYEQAKALVAQAGQAN